ncbi:MAG: chromosomal replication initiator protein DnaA, partial [Leptospira sp.]|nr:chromosomal replication initiator protein DnaA [Leptospira sp.]
MDTKWPKILEEISKQIPPKYFSNFIEPLKFQKSNSESFVIVAPSSGIKRHVETKYLTYIEDAIYQVLGDKYSIQITTESEEGTLSLKETLT